LDIVVSAGNLEDSLAKARARVRFLARST